MGTPLGALPDVTPAKCSASNGLTFIESAPSTFDFLQDIGGGSCPDVRFGVVVVLVDIGVDGPDKFIHTAERPSAQALLREVAEESLDHIEPRRTGRGEVDVESFVAGEPALHLFVFVGRVVVNDQVQLFVERGLAVNQPQELQPFMRLAPTRVSGHGIVEALRRLEEVRAQAISRMRENR